MWALISATLLVTPVWSLDPINPIKMLAVTAAGFMGLGVLVANQRSINFQRFRIPMGLIVSFMFWQLIVLVVTGGDYLQQLFGTAGRNTGFMTYLAFSLLFIVSVAASSEVVLKRFFLTSLIVGFTSVGYGVIQVIGADPFDWVNPYSPVIGFLGNPNFQSSLLGVLGSIVFTQILSGSVKARVKVGYFLYLVMSIFVIRESDSQQGFLVLAIGAGIALGIFVNGKSSILGASYLGLGLFATLVAIIGMLNKGPLAGLLYKDSVTFRGDYWRAGWNMTLENPIFGVGLDSYGDWYRRSRSLEATLRRGPEVTSNAAHNVFLDISSYGGFPLVLIYIALIVLVIISVVKVFKREKEFNPGFVGLIAGWVAFQAQSIISINQIGLALWGWVISGLIIGYEINTRSGGALGKERVGKKPAVSSQTSAGTTLGLFVGLIVGTLVGLPPYLASTQFRSSLETGNPDVIREAAYIWPIDPTRMVQVAVTLNDNKLELEGLKVAVDATLKFPDKYAVWVALSLMKSATADQKAQALAQMKRLDPLNPNLK
jgi:O-antigen ligase